MKTKSKGEQETDQRPAAPTGGASPSLAAPPGGVPAGPPPEIALPPI
jgi:hypothetical protein